MMCYFGNNNNLDNVDNYVWKKVQIYHTKILICLAILSCRIKVHYLKHIQYMEEARIKWTHVLNVVLPRPSLNFYFQKQFDI